MQLPPTPWRDDRRSEELPQSSESLLLSPPSSSCSSTFLHRKHLFHRRPFARLREAGTSVDSSRPPFRRHRLIIGFDRAAPTLRVCHSSRRDPELSKLPRAWMSETREASDDETSETTDRPTAIIKIFNYRDVISLGTRRMVVRSTPEKLKRLESRK